MGTIPNLASRYGIQEEELKQRLNNIKGQSMLLEKNKKININVANILRELIMYWTSESSYSNAQVDNVIQREKANEEETRSEAARTIQGMYRGKLGPKVAQKRKNNAQEKAAEAAEKERKQAAEAAEKERKEGLMNKFREAVDITGSMGVNTRKLAKLKSKRRELANKKKNFKSFHRKCQWKSRKSKERFKKI